VEREGVVRIGGAAAVLLAAGAAGLVVWLALGALTGGSELAAAPGRLAAPAAPAQRAPAPDPKAPQQRVEPGNLAVAGTDVLVKYQECPAKCLVDVLEHSRPQAAIGAWCKPQDAELFTCVSVVDDARVELYECRAWIVAQTRAGGSKCSGPARPTVLPVL